MYPHMEATQHQYPDSEADVFGHGGDFDDLNRNGNEDNAQIDGMNPAYRREPLGHGEGSGVRTEPSRHVARKRGTTVWEHTYSYGQWRWTPTSSRCTGNPCFCDLQ